MHSRIFSAATAAYLVAAPSIVAQTTSPDAASTSASLADIGEVLRTAVEDQRVAGAVVGVARRGEVLYLEAVGMQDLASRTPMTEASLFRMYSMSKAVTAVAAMMLHEQGRFQLSDPVSRYLPAFDEVVVLNADGTTRPPVRPITVEHLLLHTSGLSHRTSAEYREARVRERDMTLDQLIANMVRVPLRFDPGAGYLYSESSSVVGRLIEIWSGQSLDAYLREQVFEPLRMTDTGFWVEPARQDRLTTVYAPVEGGGLRPIETESIPFTVRPTLLEGAVGLVSTVPDFLRFASMLANGGELDGVRLLRTSTVASMVRNGLPEEILRSRRGSGWALANVSVLVDASGASDGARAGEYRWDGSAGTEFWVDPASGTALVTAWQTQPANPTQLRQRITALVRRAIPR